MKLTFLKRILTFSLILALALSTSVFADKGKDEEKKSEKAYISVADGVVRIVKDLKLNIDHIRFIKEPKASDYFTKVADDAPYASAFIIASLNGLEVPKDIDPNAKITKEQFNHFLYKAMITKGEFAFIEIFYEIKDADQVTPEYMDSIQKMLITKVLLLDKKGNIYPKANITMGEAMIRIKKTLKVIKEAGFNLTAPTEPVKPEEPKNPEEPAADNKDITMSLVKVNDAVNKVVVKWSNMPNPGYGISIAKIEFNGTDAVVYYSLKDPEPGKMYPMVISEGTVETFVSSTYKVTIKQLEVKKG